MEEHGMFEGGGLWIFALLILLLLGNGGGIFGGNRVGEAYATQADIQRAVDNNTIQRTLATNQQETERAVKDGNFNLLGELRDIQLSTSAGFSTMQTCCCETQRAIDRVKYEGAMNTAKILETINAIDRQNLDRENQRLYMRNLVCGIPKVSNFAYYPYPVTPPATTATTTG